MSGRCRVLPVEISRNAVRFRWEIDAAQPAWARSGFSVEYEADLDLTSLPRSLLWTLFLGATHPVWSLLDGYTVEFDEAISDVELTFWSGMAAASRIAFEIPAPTDQPGVRFVSMGGAPPPEARPVRAAGPPAVLLSCGKESLLSLGLLREVRGEAVAINIESRMTGSHDHESAFRDWALGAVGKLPGVTVRRIRSDIRSAWGKNDYAVRRGGNAYVNELADAMLYASFALPLAFQHGFSWIVAGSEWGDVYTRIGADRGAGDSPATEMTSGVWRFDRFFTSTGAALSAVNALWQRRFGVGYTSVIHPISQYLVERILLRRYPDLAGLQHSCYRAQPDVRACQSCDKCFRVTALALASAADPAIVGMDVNKVFSRWSDAARQFEAGGQVAHYESFDHMSAFALASADESVAERFFKPRGIDDVLKLKPARAKRRFRRIRARLGTVPAERLDTVKRGFLQYLPDEFRAPIQRIMEDAAPYDETNDADEHAARARIIATLTEPLARDVAVTA